MLQLDFKIALQLSAFTFYFRINTACKHGWLASTLHANDEQDTEMWQAIAAISAGASLGAVLRWLLSINFNTALPSLQPGTLTANLLGGYLIGIGVAYFGNHPNLPPEWRLFAITGFLGGLTTFSTFSAEVIALLQSGKLTLACTTIVVHVIGSLLLTLLGIFTVSVLRAG